MMVKPTGKKFELWFTKQDSDNHNIIKVWLAVMLYAVSFLVRLTCAVIWYAIVPLLQLLFGWITRSSAWRVIKHRIVHVIRRVWP